MATWSVLRFSGSVKPSIRLRCTSTHVQTIKIPTTCENGEAGDLGGSTLVLFFSSLGTTRESRKSQREGEEPRIQYEGGPRCEDEQEQTKKRPAGIRQVKRSLAALSYLIAATAVMGITLT